MNLYDILPVNKHGSTSSRRKRSSLYSDYLGSYSERRSYDSDLNAHVIVSRDPLVHNIKKLAEKIERVEF